MSTFSPASRIGERLHVHFANFSESSSLNFYLLKLPLAKAPEFHYRVLLSWLCGELPRV